MTATNRPPGRRTRAISRSASCEIRDVVKHPRRDYHVERAVGERQTPATSPSVGVDPARARQRDHALRLVDRDDLGAERIGRPILRSRHAHSRPPAPARDSTSATAARSSSTASGPLARAHAAARTAKRPSSAYSRATSSGSLMLTRHERLPRQPAPRLAAEPRAHRRADVGELALVDPPRRIRPLRVREEERVLARVVGRRRRRVAAVIRGEDEQVARPQLREQVGQARVEVLQAAVEVHRVVAMAPEHVRLDEVREDESRVELAQELLRLLDPLGVRLRGMRLVDVAAGEDVGDLADAVDREPGLADLRQVVRLARLQRVVVAVRRCATYDPGSPVNGRAMTRPTASLPVRISRAASHAS